MKKLITLTAFLLLISTNLVFAANEWRAGTGVNTVLGTATVSDIDAVTFQNIVAPLDRLLIGYRKGAQVQYNSASTIDVLAGEVACANSGETITKFRRNTSTTNVTWSDLDTGAEASSTTYYIYANCDADATTFTLTISANSSTPTGVTTYARLGSFFNDSSSNILNDERITNDDDYFALRLGDWSSKTVGTTYQATTDGFVVAYSNETSTANAYIRGYTDASSSPTTLRAQDLCNSGSPACMSAISFPVKINDYYKVTQTNTSTSVMYFIPLQ